MSETPWTAPVVMPVVPLRGLVAIPGSMMQFDVGRRISVKAVESAMKQDQKVFLTAQKDTFVEEPVFDDLFSVGVVAHIKQIVKMPGENMRILVEGISRAKIVSGIEVAPFFTAVVLPLNPSHPYPERRVEMAYVRALRERFDEYRALTPKMPSEIALRVFEEENLAVLCDFIASNIPLNYTEKQKILECVEIVERAESLLALLQTELEILKIDEEISEKLKEQIDKNQRDYYMREQIKILQNELGEQDTNVALAQDYRDRLEKLSLPQELYTLLDQEIERLARMPFGSHEVTALDAYLDLCLSLPYGKYTKDRRDIARAREILDHEHYGLKEVKDRVIEYLAAHTLAPDFRGQILCLVGPPGVGKTSIARSVAHALNRKFVRMSLGGVRDEAEIRGHRRTYIGAMEGRVIHAVKEAGSMNPVILLDEIDKLGADYKGDPSAALLEVLDPEQNKTFRDHFLGFDFDLSNVLFLTTANADDTIPPALLDRMDVLYLTSYTQEEKKHIFRDHLLPRQLKKHRLTKRQLRVSDGALEKILTSYTKEAGVRNLDRLAGSLCRKTAVKLLEGEKQVLVEEGNLSAFLGAPKFIPDALPKTDPVGLVNGLAYTTVGGELLTIEVNVMEGTGKLELTGSLGDVMKESAKAAESYIRSRATELGIPGSFYKDKDIHIHVPEGAIPKDGPSAGITMATALISALTGRPVDRLLAMTGEITLRGRVLPIGGLKEKTMAAYKAGIRTVLVPAANAGDLAELDPVVRENIRFVPVSTMDEVLPIALRPALPQAESKPFPAESAPKTDRKEGAWMA